MASRHHQLVTRLREVRLRRAFSSEPAVVASEAAARRSRGLHFEAQVVALLRACECELRPTQASNDGGIDHQVRVLVNISNVVYESQIHGR